MNYLNWYFFIWRHNLESCSNSIFPPILGSCLNSRFCSGKSWILIDNGICWENSWILIDIDILKTKILNPVWWVKIYLALPWVPLGYDAYYEGLMQFNSLSDFLFYHCLIYHYTVFSLNNWSTLAQLSLTFSWGIGSS